MEIGCQSCILHHRERRVGASRAGASSAFFTQVSPIRESDCDRRRTVNIWLDVKKVLYFLLVD